MDGLRPLLYAIIVFVALGVISLVVVCIMLIMYKIVHKNEKKPEVGNKVEAKVVSQ